MRRVYAMLERLRGSLAAVLIDGESGTGKDVVAQTLHRQSLVADGPFVAVNCGALDRSLVRSELFGHARGAFTGAVEQRRGAFEAASGGTLFLDEIGELPLDVQPVLLRALESNNIQRVGETVDRKVNVRLIAATNRDLEELVTQGKFREDLYYRLLVVRLSLPPLRERRQDIAELVNAFLSELAAPPVTPEELRQLQQRNWPGNVRQLKNAAQAYAALGAWPDAERNRPESLDSSLESIIDLARPYAELKEHLLERFQRAYVEKLLLHTNGNQTEAARISGMDRSHLNRVLRRLS
jgi:DNA-binding NtrC family response regulator